MKIKEMHVRIPEAGRSQRELAMGAPRSQLAAVKSWLATRRRLGREVLMWAASIIVACFGVFLIVD